MKKPLSHNERIMKAKSFSAEEVAKEIIWAFKRGVSAAAEVANSYNSSTTHPYMLGDCILGKLNQLGDKKPRKNEQKLKVSK